MSSDNQYSHQNWTPVVLTKENKNNKSKQKHVDPNFIKMKKLEDTTIDDEMKIEKVDVADYKTITALRNAKRLTQRELAQKLNLQQSVIVELERGQMAKNKNLTNKIKRFLETCPEKSANN